MNILFMCVANSARSQMAEGIAKTIFPKNVRIESAGSQPKFVHPLAIEVLKEIQIDISQNTSKTFTDIDKSFTENLDYIITLCAEEVCPVVPSKAKKIHWPLPDPANANKIDSDSLKNFKQIRDILVNKLTLLKKELTNS
ncbi:arsenate reductase ArsC [bacterium]|nr:arsenate reductase ArsC [bacterium]